MGKSKRVRAARREKQNVAGGGGAVDVVSGGEDAQYSPYSGANQSLARGQVFHLSLETRDEMDSYSHQEILRKTRWMFKNLGFIKGFVRNASDLIGYLMPQSLAKGDGGEGKEWADLAEAAFRRRTETAEVFDRAGKFNFKTAQLMLTRQALRDGDMLTVLAESKTGGAMFGFYEAHQLRTPKKVPKDQAKQWQAGVRLNAEDRPWEYGLGKDGDDAMAVAANRCIYFGEYESSGNRRAYPPLAHAVNHSLDVAETWANVKQAIKAAALLGFVKETQPGANQTKSAAGMPGALLKRQNPSAPGELDTAQVWGGGQIPDLAPGQTLKVLHDSRPSQNVQDFIKGLQYECAYGFGLSPEVLMDISGLTSAGVRFVLDRASRWIELRQLALQEWCRRVWVYVLAKEMQAGRLPYPPEGVEWWAVEWTPLRDLTIDRGKAREAVEEVKSGMGTHSGYWRSKGADWKDAARQRVAEEKFHRELCDAEGVDYDRVFPPLPGATLVPEKQGGSGE